MEYAVYKYANIPVELNAYMLSPLDDVSNQIEPPLANSLDKRLWFPFNATISTVSRMLYNKL